LPDPGKDAEGKPAKPAPRTVFGKKSFEVIRTDANLNVVPAGDPMALANLGEQNAALKAENDRLKARIAELEAGAQAEQSEARPARKK
jgi:cell division protein FtsB